MPPRVRKPPRWSCSRSVPVKSHLDRLGGVADGGSPSRGVRCYVEPSPAGGYFVRLRGEAAPLSRHDTEEEAEAAAAAYERGLARDGHRRVRPLRDGAEVLDARRSARRTSRCSSRAGRTSPTSRSTSASWRPATALSVDELAFFTEIDHVDHEAIGALDPATGEGVGVARYVRERERPHVAEAAVTVVDAWQHRGLGGKLLRRLCARATENRIRVFTRVAAGVQRRDADALRPARRGHRDPPRRPDAGDRRRAAGRAADARAHAARGRGAVACGGATRDGLRARQPAVRRRRRALRGPLRRPGHARSDGPAVRRPDAEPVPGRRPHGVGGDPRAGDRAAGGGQRGPGRARDARAADRGRRLRRLLLLDRARDEHRPPVPPRPAAAAELPRICRSATTAARARSSSPARRSRARTASGRSSARPRSSTSRSSSAS